MTPVRSVLENAFADAGRQEDACWDRLTQARASIVENATVPEVTARKWMSAIESGNKPLSDPENVRILDNIARWAGPEATGNWVKAYRSFGEAASRVHRAGIELADHAGINVRSDLEALRDQGALRQRLVAIAARVNPTVDIHLPKELFAEGPGLIASGLKSTDRTEVAGMYEPMKHLVTISISPRFDREDTAWHESWHSIEPVLSQSEDAALQKAFPANDHMTSKERVAVAFARWAKLRDRLPEGDSRAERATNEKLRKSLLPPGQKAIGEIFEKAYDGTFGKRMANVMAQTNPAFLAKSRPKVPLAAKARDSQPEASRATAKSIKRSRRSRL
ncbi:hypothetical protein [Thalassospira xiamenensis]|jgi:hypothetical protein|uniref:hypothetical protein n=1 Tax=Thalassospira xiamenensis TaxID=220697 RepID=UPI000DEE1C09|nr:hypothetical protein [Thalassospira xiamenensis]RCK34593.1 hypothetical protein TH24_20575 [Thalassospira xiamenensis]